MSAKSANDPRPLLGGIEAGGTKFVCAIGTGPEDIRAEERFETATPEVTLQRAADFFRRHPRLPEAIGIGAFGPADLDPDSPTYGHITSTPKTGWDYVDIVGYLQRYLDVPVGFDTDVNAAVLGEHTWGAGQGLRNLLYLTIGTGIGGGALLNGVLVRGLLHPEMGHLIVPRAPGDEFGGVCPYHGACLEGLATGPAIAARWGRSAQSLPRDHAAWGFEAHYLGIAITNLILAFSPERIILGGGVMQQRHLFAAIRNNVQTNLNGYLGHPYLTRSINSYIVPPGLGSRAGVLGAMVLAQNALDQRSTRPEP